MSWGSRPWQPSHGPPEGIFLHQMGAGTNEKKGRDRKVLLQKKSKLPNPSSLRTQKQCREDRSRVGSNVWEDSDQRRSIEQNLQRKRRELKMDWKIPESGTFICPHPCLVESFFFPRIRQLLCSAGRSLEMPFFGWKKEASATHV